MSLGGLVCACECGCTERSEERVLGSLELLGFQAIVSNSESILGSKTLAL